MRTLKSRKADVQHVRVCSFSAHKTFRSWTRVGFLDGCEQTCEKTAVIQMQQFIKKKRDQKRTFTSDCFHNASTKKVKSIFYTNTENVFYLLFLTKDLLRPRKFLPQGKLLTFLRYQMYWWMLGHKLGKKSN